MSPEEIMVYCAKRGYGQQYTRYWLLHTSCEARSGEPSAAPHHIRTRGAGGTDDFKNLLALSAAKHREIHAYGVNAFCDAHPWLRKKIVAALAVPKRIRG